MPLDLGAFRLMSNVFSHEFAEDSVVSSFAPRKKPWDGTIKGVTFPPYGHKRDVVSERLETDEIKTASGSSVHRAAKVYYDPEWAGLGGTVLAFTMNNKYAEQLMEMRGAENIVAKHFDRLIKQMVDEAYRQSSMNLTYDQLDEMGNPYGWKTSWAKGHQKHRGKQKLVIQGRNIKERVSKAKLSDAAVSEHEDDPRGTDGGAYRSSWLSNLSNPMRLQITPQGVIVRVGASRLSAAGRPVDWFLFHGTTKMQPHSPQRTLLDKFKGQFEAANMRLAVEIGKIVKTKQREHDLLRVYVPGT